MYSIPSASTLRPSSHDERGGFGIVNGLGSASDSGNGLGNLADELAEAWDEEGDADADEGSSGIHGVEREQIWNGNMGTSEALQHGLKKEDSGFPMSPSSAEPSTIFISPQKPLTLLRHRRQNSHYYGSEYGDDSDFEDTTDISASLEARMAAVESLVRRGTESNGSDADMIVQRVAESLKDLGSQSSLEQSATRIITIHAALTSHITHQTRVLQNLSHPLFSPLSIPPDTSSIDELLPLLSTLHPLPAPDPQPLPSMLRFHSSTRDLLSTLSSLSDSLHMTRQTTSLASRRLRAAKELVYELRREADTREEGVKWVEEGQWNDRLAGRECARMCGDVVGGFEEVCNGWRERLAKGTIGNKGVGVEVGAA